PIRHTFPTRRSSDLLNGLQGFDNGKLLGRFNYVFTPAHPGGVDQCVILAVALVGNIYTVTGGTGFVVYHYPVFAQEAVNQRRFTDRKSTRLNSSHVK